MVGASSKSPANRHPDVDRALARAAPPVRALAARLRALVHAEVPAATEALAYGCPFFLVGGVRFAYVSPARGHVTFGLVRGADVREADGVLEGTGRSGVRSARFVPGEALPERPLRKALHAAARLAAAEASLLD